MNKTNNFIFSFNKPTNKELNELVKIDELTYPIIDDRANFEELCMWRNCNSNSFILLKNNNKVIGYIILLPLTEKCYKKYRNGEIMEEEINESEILEWTKNPFVLFNNISIIPKYQNGTAIKVLTNALLEFLNNLKGKGIVLRNVVAEVDSPDGEKYLTNHFGFKPLKTENKRHKLFELQKNKDLLSAFKE